jgi:hypothetical protein
MMGSKTKELITVLQSLIDLLQRDNETHWSKWMRVSKSRIEASDFSGITHLLGAYGGMGSFNDLILGQNMQRGKIVWKDNQTELNEELSRLRNEAWELATYIKRSQD